MNKFIRIIGDIHGKLERYRDLIINIDYSLQLGDFNLYDGWDLLNNSPQFTQWMNPDNHKIIAGNHDNYSICKSSPFYLGEYGNINFHDMNFFFIRGAESIDKLFRIENKDWWSDEELNYIQIENLLIEYKKSKPDIVLSHTCPINVSKMLFPLNKTFNSMTGMLLNELFNIHKPKLWIFGHWHDTIIKNIIGTEFICLDELDYIDYYSNKTVDENINHIINEKEK